MFVCYLRSSAPLIIQENKLHYTKSFTLRISSVNVTKFARNFAFTDEILTGKHSFLCSVSVQNTFFFV